MFLERMWKMHIRSWKLESGECSGEDLSTCFKMQWTFSERHSYFLGRCCECSKEYFGMFLEMLWTLLERHAYDLGKYCEYSRKRLNFPGGGVSNFEGSYECSKKDLLKRAVKISKKSHIPSWKVLWMSSEIPIKMSISLRKYLERNN